MPARPNLGRTGASVKLRNVLEIPTIYIYIHIMLFLYRFHCILVYSYLFVSGVGHDVTFDKRARLGLYRGAGITELLLQLFDQKHAWEQGHIKVPKSPHS